MTRFTLTTLLLAAAAGAVTAPAFGQRYPDPYYGNRDPYYGNRDPYYGNRDPYYGDRDGRYGDRDRYSRGGYGDPVSRAVSDLQRAASMNRYDGHERHHFDEAINHLLQFQNRWAGGRFDRGALDRAISNMNDLARADQLHPRDREVLSRDLYALRALRDNGGGYGDRRGSYGRW